VTWREFAAAQPDMSRFALEQFQHAGMALIGTIRSDGSPRISSCQPCVLDGALLLGMMWRSRKALDLFRDRRIVIRNAICTNLGTERELTLRGQAAEVLDAELRRRFVEAVSETTVWKEPRFHLFSVEIESASLVEYRVGERTVKLWPKGVESTHPYG
jgi:hypothetical protein